MIFAKETPHTWLWITFEAKKLKDDCLPTPSTYQEVLKAECKKLQKTNTPGILCYLGQMLTEKQKQRMEEFANPKENLFVLDFNEVLDNTQPSCEKNNMLIDYI